MAAARYGRSHVVSQSGGSVQGMLTIVSVRLCSCGFYFMLCSAGSFTYRQLAKQRTSRQA